MPYKLISLNISFNLGSEVEGCIRLESKQEVLSVWEASIVCNLLILNCAKQNML